jgi:transposase
VSKRWKDPEKRMAAVVRMRAGGLSLRQIGDRLGVSYQTVARDLARYEDQEVSHLLSHLALSDPLNVTGDVTP